jgi:hypothetical protein
MVAVATEVTNEDAFRGPPFESRMPRQPRIQPAGPFTKPRDAAKSPSVVPKDPGEPRPKCPEFAFPRDKRAAAEQGALCWAELSHVTCRKGSAAPAFGERPHGRHQLRTQWLT